MKTPKSLFPIYNNPSPLKMREMPASINMYEVAEKLMELGDVDDPIYQSALAKLLNRPGRELHTRYPLRHPIPLKDKPISLVAPLKHDRNHNNNSSSTKGVDAKSETECLRSIVLSHLRLLEKQQAMVAEKEREIVELKRENLTLKARLDRMDRRICLSGKSPVNNPKQIANSSTNNPGSNKKRTTAERVRAGPSESEEELEPKRKKARVKSNSIGSDHSSAQRDGTKSPDDSKIHVWAEHSCANEISGTHEEVEVPCWRVNPIAMAYNVEGTEHMSDATFEKRHQKCEVEEKRIKKWDAQRLREEERRRQSLANNRFSINNFCSGVQKWDESGRNTPVSTPFDLKQIEAIEVCDRLPRSTMEQKSSASTTTKGNKIRRRD